MSSITLDGVTKAYGAHRVIHDLDLEIAEGEFVALVGPSGCGKSTTLRLIAGLDGITGGTIAFDGKRMNEKTPLERQIAMVFQSYALYPHMTVRKNLSFGLENLRMPRAEITERVGEAARMLELETYLDRKPKALSGGQRQRVAIGRAIVRHPRVFLFDEPLSNLDAKLRVQTRGEITRLHKQLKTTMIYVTHDQVEAMTMAQKIVVMNKGRIEQVGRPLELFDTPANLFVAGFIGSPRINLYDGEVVAAGDDTMTVSSEETGAIEIETTGGQPGQKIKIGLRPSHFSLQGSGQGTGKARPVSLPLQIENVESLGHETYIYGRLNGRGAETIIHIQNHFAADAGEVVQVSPKLSHVHLFDAETGAAIGRSAT